MANSPAGVLAYVTKASIDDLDIITYSTDPFTFARITDNVKFKNLGDQLGEIHLDIGHSLGLERVTVDYEIKLYSHTSVNYFRQSDGFWLGGGPGPESLVTTKAILKHFHRNEFLLLGIATRGEIIARGLKMDGTEVGPESFTYTNASARVNASNLTEVDLGKLAFQSDNQSYWELTKKSPDPTWIRVNNPGLREQALSSLFLIKPALFFPSGQDSNQKYLGGKYTDDGITLSARLSCGVFDTPGRYQARPWKGTINKGSNYFIQPAMAISVDFSSIPYGFDPPFQERLIPVFPFQSGFERTNPLIFDTRSDFYSEGIVKWGNDPSVVHLYDIGSLSTTMGRLSGISPKLWKSPTGLGSISTPNRIRIDQNGLVIIDPGAIYTFSTGLFTGIPCNIYTEGIGRAEVTKNGIGLSLYPNPT